MTERRTPKQARYQIKVRGSLDAGWANWFGGMTIVRERTGDGSIISTLTGIVADQSALRGILCKLWDLNLILISVTRVG
jgi:hypothetical protein